MVLPGITGLWLVSGRSNLSFEDYMYPLGPRGPACKRSVRRSRFASSLADVRWRIGKWLRPWGYAVVVAGEVVVRQARPGDARGIAEVSVASRRWSYHDLLAEADLDTLSVEEATADFAEGLAELPPGSAVFVTELAGRLVGYAYVLPSPDPDVPPGTSELGSLYVTEDIAGTGVARALMTAAIEHARVAGHGFLTAWVRPENGRARRFYEKCGAQPDGGERSGPHDVLPIEIQEIRYRMSLESRRSRSGGSTPVFSP